MITLIERLGIPIASVCLKTAVGALRSLSNPLTWSFPVGIPVANESTRLLINRRRLHDCVEVRKRDSEISE